MNYAQCTKQSKPTLWEEFTRRDATRHEKDVNLSDWDLRCLAWDDMARDVLEPTAREREAVYEAVANLVRARLEKARSV